VTSRLYSLALHDALPIYLGCNRICHVQLQRPATSRCFGGTSICAVPNFTLLPYDKSTSARCLRKARLKAGLPPNADIPLLRGHVSFISWRVFLVGRACPQPWSAPVCTLLNGRLRFS